jgi:branched-chain amino acid transport system ATP-binding protein
MLAIENLTTGYTRVDVIKGMSLRVAPGTITAILGANGAGKTALLRAISGLNPIRAGRIVIDGKRLDQLQPSRIVAEGVIQVPQGRALFGAMSVRENLDLGAYLLRDAAERANRLGAVYAMFPVLHERRAQAAAYLSGGEQQMLAIGRALMSRPRLLVLDEPSLGLAPKVFDAILDRVRDIHAGGASVLIAEQSVRKVLRIADHCYVLENGVVTLQGSGAELARDSRVEQAYLGKNH